MPCSAAAIRNSSWRIVGVVVELGEDRRRASRATTPPGADLADGVLDPGQQGAEVVAAGDDERLARLGRGVDEGPPALAPPSAAMSQPKPAMLRRMSSGDSSNVTKTPGSPASAMPAARNCAAKTVLALPEVPETSVDRPSGQAAVGDQVEPFDLGPELGDPVRR